MFLGARLASGVRALYELAVLPERRSAVRDLARKCGVSEPFLRRILLDLRAKGYVEAQKGRMGGFRLVRDPTHIKVRDIAEALEKSPVLVFGRVQRDLMPLDERCLTYPFWKAVEEKFHGELGAKTLADVVAAAQAPRAPGRARPAKKRGMARSAVRKSGCPGTRR